MLELALLTELNRRIGLRDHVAVPDDPAAPTTAYFQYAGVIRDSDWAPPLP